MKKVLLSILSVSVVSGCSYLKKEPDGYDAAGNQLHGMKEPGVKNYYKIGKPYKVDGKWYTPAPVDRYAESGVSSWYGHGFHGLPTANGEIFDQYKLTAAHKTLPLPSILKVTNLDNGRTVNVRVNDRGPFVGDRLIDVSYRAAQVLGFDAKGLTRVKLEYLPQESQIAALQAGARPDQLRNINQIATAAGDAGYANNYNQPGFTQAATQEFTPQPSNAVQVQPLQAAGNNSFQSASGVPQATSFANNEQTVPLSGTVPTGVVANGSSNVYGSGNFTPAPTGGNASSNYESGFTQSPVYGDQSSYSNNTYTPSMQTAAPLANGQIFVQAGAFSNPQSAQQLVSQLQNSGQNAFVANTTVDGQQFYRVRMGPVANVNDAETMVTRALNSGAADARVVVE